MEKLATTLSQYIDPNQLQRSIPEYLWFVIAVLGLGFIIYIFNRLVNYLISTVKELKESNEENRLAIAVLREMMEGLKHIVLDHDRYIRDNPQPKRKGQ